MIHSRTSKKKYRESGAYCSRNQLIKAYVGNIHPKKQLRFTNPCYQEQQEKQFEVSTRIRAGRSLLRCHGRLISENLSQNTVHPKLVPKNNDFTNLVIISIHEKLMHTGVPHTLAAIRSEFWVPQGRAAVRRLVISCRRCRRFQEGPYKKPSMAPYPSQREEESRPFSYTGLYYL